MRIAIDTGGTFTDCVFVRDGKLHILKVLSTPHDPAAAIGHALEKVFAGGRSFSSDRSQGKKQGLQPLKSEILDLTCGTTVGTNALLERRGGRVALVTTAGFEDVIEIGRQARPRLYDFFVERPAPLVPAARRFGLRERIAADGRVLLRASREELARVARAVERSHAEAVAVCLLFSFTNPAHEKIVARLLRRRGLRVAVSHEILPEFREYERTATTVINAYLIPVMSDYLGEIERQARVAVGQRRVKVRIMQSSGGIVSARVSAREPVRTILSGPAGGILGAKYVAELAGFPRIISFDMGGTSTDVALVEGDLRTTNESSVADLPVAVPMLDIHTVGAGGGSLARFDRAGALRVGPESAGADPGPICYGRGTQPTVTDAHLILGRIAPQGFLGGEFRLDAQRTRVWMERARGKMRSVEGFAQGILDVANATMEKAIRVISVERGYDPRDYTLVAFGGAGGLHACELAAALRMPRVLIPKFPGGLSALGILRADVVKDFSQTVRLPVHSREAIAAALRRAFAAIERHGRREMRAEGFPANQVRSERLLDMRYVGQAYELTVPAAGDFIAAFHRVHDRRYGYADPARAVEVVNVRARLVGATPKPGLPRMRPPGRSAQAALLGHRRAIFAGRALNAAVFDREKLRAGNRFAGPAIVAEYSATSVVPPGWRARVDVYGNLVLARGGSDWV
jgi:N-methylhydantoinase A